MRSLPDLGTGADTCADRDARPATRDDANSCPEVGTDPPD